jgi:long-chain acyl-CoA synthetase
VNTVGDLIARQALERPNAWYAISADGAARITYQDLADNCARVGALLDTLGVAPGQTVSLAMPNGLTTLLLLLGTMASGRCVHPVNLLSQPEQMRYVLAHSDCRAVWVAPEWEAPVRGMLEGLGRPVPVMVMQPHAAQIDAPAAATGGAGTASRMQSSRAPASLSDDTALLMYTSGTTGSPKGVMLTHASLVANARSVSFEHGLTADDRVLGVLPLYHINAFAVTMLAPLAHGGSVVLAPRFSAAAFWQQATLQRCSWINVVPTIVSYLLEGQTPLREALAAIRFCRSASAPLPVEHLRAFEEKFGIGIIETMGLTETVAPCFSNPLDPVRRKPGSVGRASGCEARVIDAALREVADGVTGELAVRGPNVMRGYYKNPEATAASFTPDGWLRTGDLGQRDSDGFFFVTGRIKELIIKGGENIAPREIDEAVLRHSAVLDAAAVGIPDRHYGQEIMVCVVLRAGATCTEDELRAHCLEHLGRYKTPRLIRFVDELPRGPSGKVQRLKLAALADGPMINT